MAKRAGLQSKIKRASKEEKQDLYIELAKLYIPDSLQLAENFLKFALQYPKGNKNPEIYLIFADIYLQKRKLDTAGVFIDKGIKWAKKHNNTHDLGILYYKKGDIAYYGNNYETANNLYQKAFDFAKSSGDQQMQADILIDRAYIYEFWAKGDEALNILQQSLKISDSCNYIKGKARASLILGNIYHGMDKHNKALEYYEKTLTNAHKINNIKGMGIAYGNLGMAYLEMHQDSLALENLLKSNKLLYKINDFVTIANNNLDIAIIYARKGDSEKSLHYANSGIGLMKKYGMKEDLLKTLNSKATCLSLLKKYEQSNLYLDSCIILAKETGFGLMLQKSLKVYSNNLQQLGRYQKAFDYLKMQNTIKDSIMTDKFQKRLARFETEYKTLEKEKEIEVLTHKQILQKARTKIIVISGISLIVLILIIGYSRALKHKKENEISQLKLEKSQLKSDQLSKQIEIKNKKLTSHALNMMQKNQLLQSISQDITSIINNKKDNGVQFNLKQLNSNINKVINSEKDWDTFKVYFEQVNKDFISHFKKLSEELTTTDIRLATLIKLNMTNKEIASLLNITHQSVKNAQYRLKNKIGLSTNEDLRSFIWNL